MKTLGESSKARSEDWPIHGQFRKNLRVQQKNFVHRHSLLKTELALALSTKFLCHRLCFFHNRVEEIFKIRNLDDGIYAYTLVSGFIQQHSLSLSVLEFQFR